MHMKQRGGNFFWPQRDDKVIVSIDHVICLLSPPVIRGRSGRQYEIIEDERHEGGHVIRTDDCLTNE